MSRKHLLIALLCLVCLAAFSVGGRHRPAPRRSLPKTEENRVHLLHADVLRYNQWLNPDAQILTGHVRLRHKGATLSCDSAYFFEATNSFEAFSNVRMVQGDTLTLTSEYAYYDGDQMMAEARRNVVLKNRKSTLYTDSLNYDRMYGIGYFFDGGKLVDGKSTLTSDWGEYHTDDKHSVFNYDVRLRGDNYNLTTDTLYYNTDTKIAHALGPSVMVSGKSHVATKDGYFNTNTEKSELFSRSVVSNGDKIIIGDSIYHDDRTAISEGFGNVVYTDTVNKNRLIADYCYYDDSIGYGLATKRALAIDYSQKDTLYAHADTFKIFTFNIRTDSVYRKLHAYPHVRAYRTDVQAVCDSLVYNSKDSCMTMYRDPIVWNEGQQLLGEVIEVYMADSTIDRSHVIGQALSVEMMSDSVHFNQITSKEMWAYFRDGKAYRGDAIDNVQVVYYPVDDSDSTLIGLNYTETSKLIAYLDSGRMKKIWMPKAEGTLYPMSQIPPDKPFLPNYQWFDYVRPLNKDDIYVWRPKKAGSELKEIKRKEAPLQKLPGLPELSDKADKADAGNKAPDTTTPTAPTTTTTPPANE